MDDKQLEAGEAVVYTVRGVLVPATAPIGDAVAGQDECLRTVKEGDTMSDIAKVICDGTSLVGTWASACAQ